MTALPLSVESALRARLALDYDWHCDRDTSLTRHCGSSSLAPAIATGIRKMDRDLATKRQAPSAIMGRHYPGEWPLDRRLAHAEAMKEYYAGRKAAAARKRRAARKAEA